MTLLQGSSLRVRSASVFLGPVHTSLLTVSGPLRDHTRPPSREVVGKILLYCTDLFISLHFNLPLLVRVQGALPFTTRNSHSVMNLIMTL